MDCYCPKNINVIFSFNAGIDILCIRVIRFVFTSGHANLYGQISRRKKCF